MKYLILCDIDGTIRDFNGEISENTVKAIKKLRNKGHKVFISSGRSESEIEKRVIDIGFDGVISSGGARLSIDDECIFDKVFPDEFKNELSKFLIKNEFTIQFQTAKSGYVLKSQEESLRKICDDTQKMLGSDAAEMMAFPKSADTIEDIENLEKIIFFGDTVSEKVVIEEFGKRSHIIPFSFNPSSEFGGELSLKGINKGFAAKHLIEHYGMDKNSLIAIGDSDNDIEMLEYAGTGIAMGNSTRNLKKVADIISSDIKEDGFFEAFKNLGLI